MKFMRCVWEKGYTKDISAASVRCTAKRLAKAREAVALLPDLVAQVPTVESQVEAMRQQFPTSAAEWRALWARKWREARRRLQALPPIVSAGVRRYWDSWSSARDPFYLLSFVDQAEKGRSYWTNARQIRQLALIGAKRFPADRVAAVFGTQCCRGFEPQRTPDFFKARHARKAARRRGLAYAPTAYQMPLVAAR